MCAAWASAGVAQRADSNTAIRIDGVILTLRFDSALDTVVSAPKLMRFKCRLSHGSLALSLTNINAQSWNGPLLSAFN